jgi:hypothetical protein
MAVYNDQMVTDSPALSTPVNRTPASPFKETSMDDSGIGLSLTFEGEIAKSLASSVNSQPITEMLDPNGFVAA